MTVFIMLTEVGNYSKINRTPYADSVGMQVAFGVLANAKIQCEENVSVRVTQPIRADRVCK